MTELSIAAKAIEVLVSRILDRLTQKGEGAEKLTEPITLQPERLQHHLREALGWSRFVDLVDPRGPRSVDASTIEIPIDTPRHLRPIGERSASSPVSEDQLLEAGRGNWLVYGGPGSGKSTLLKRLIRRLLTHEPAKSRREHQYPLVLRLRSIADSDANPDVSCHLASAIGVPYREIRVKPENKPYFLAGDQPLMGVVSELIDNSQGLILLDGLDEVPFYQQEAFGRSIASLAENLQQSSIILTCRTGHRARDLLTGFRRVEMNDLTWDEITNISRLWMDDPSAFLEALASKPYRDTAGRPLFLAQLLVHYENYGYLPEAPRDVYFRVTRLALEEWDRKRGVSRPTEYAGFQPEVKVRFLGALAFQLSPRFTREALVRAYNRIHSEFALPEADASKVVAEIETHTGLIVQSGYGHFEFSHLSLQEFLAADHMVRSALTFDELAERLSRDPSSLAVAVCLSSDSGRWLGQLLLAAKGDEWISAFFTRLIDERPSPGVSIELGMGLLKTLVRHESVAWRHIRRLLRLPGVRRSVKSALEGFIIEREKGGKWHLRRERELPGLLGEAPYQERLSEDVLEELVNVAGVNKIRFAGTDGESFRLY